MTDEPAEQEGPQEPQIFANADHMGGVYANWAKVTSTPYEFTIDFVRMDYGENPPRGFMVSRVTLSPGMVPLLLDTLTTRWNDWASEAIDRELPSDEDSD